jgi:hypothetical protein
MVEKLHIEELHNLYSLSGISRITNSRGMEWTGHVTRMGKKEMPGRYWKESENERNHWGE